MSDIQNSQEGDSPKNGSSEISKEKLKALGKALLAFIVGFIFVVLTVLYYLNVKDEGLNESEDKKEATESVQEEEKSEEVVELESLETDLDEVIDDLEEAAEDIDSYANEDDSVPEL